MVVWPFSDTVPINCTKLAPSLGEARMVMAHPLMPGTTLVTRPSSEMTAYLPGTKTERFFRNPFG